MKPKGFPLRAQWRRFTLVFAAVFLLLVAGIGCSDDPPESDSPDDGVVIGEAGGSIEEGDLKIVFPGGATLEPFNIQLEPLTNHGQHSNWLELSTKRGTNPDSIEGQVNHLSFTEDGQTILFAGEATVSSGTYTNTTGSAFSIKVTDTNGQPVRPELLKPATIYYSPSNPTDNTGLFLKRTAVCTPACTDAKCFDAECAGCVLHDTFAPTTLSSRWSADVTAPSSLELADGYVRMWTKDGSYDVKSVSIASTSSYRLSDTLQDNKVRLEARWKLTTEFVNFHVGLAGTKGPPAGYFTSISMRFGPHQKREYGYWAVCRVHYWRDSSTAVVKIDPDCSKALDAAVKPTTWNVTTIEITDSAVNYYLNDQLMGSIDQADTDHVGIPRSLCYELGFGCWLDNIGDSAACDIDHAKLMID